VAENKAVKKRILIIDDEKDFCDLTQSLLEAYGFDVDCALDGGHGLKKVESFSPDLIILDILMPGMDGYAVCKKLKGDRLTSKIPIIVLSAVDKEDSAKEMLLSGADGYMVKPFEIESLLFAIKGYFEK
jgi:two-component system alkaline phosphatase synthesis response regulator PhoP